MFLQPMFSAELYGDDAYSFRETPRDGGSAASSTAADTAAAGAGAADTAATLLLDGGATQEAPPPGDAAAAAAASGTTGAAAPSTTSWTADLEAKANQDFEALERIGGLQKSFNSVTAVALLIVFLKALILVMDLSPWLALTARVMRSASANLAFFLTLFFTAFLGFAGFAYFLFGSDTRVLKSMSGALLYLFSMLCGASEGMRLADLEKLDQVFAPIFYFSFYVVFVFVLLNMFLSILLSAYDLERHRLQRESESGSSTNPAVTEGLGMMWRLFVRLVLKPIGKVLEGLTWVLGLFCSDRGGGVGAAGGPSSTSGGGGEGGGGAPADQSAAAADRRRSVGDAASSACAKSVSMQEKRGRKSLVPKALSRKVTAFLNRRRGGRPGPAEAARAASTDSLRAGVDGGEAPAGGVEVSLLFLYVAIFFVLASVQSRGREAYMLVKGNLERPVEDARWIDLPPLRLVAFEQIKSLKDVKEWAENLDLYSLKST